MFAGFCKLTAGMLKQHKIQNAQQRMQIKNKQLVRRLILRLDAGVFVDNKDL